MSSAEHTSAAILNSCFTHFKPRDHVAEKVDSYSYNKDSASSLMNSEIAILLILLAIKHSF